MTGTCLITGANGFVGRAVCRDVAGRGLAVRRAARSPASGPAECIIGDIGPTTDWRDALAGCGAVVHLAARVHVMRESAADPLAEFRAVNVAGTLQLARQALELGVRRFVYISSIKVNGERTPPDRPYRADDAPHPEDPYGVSKAEAERGLRELASGTPMEVVVVRPPLVYGPGVGGNFRTMLRWLQRGLPLPLASVDNRRSLVALGNLSDLIATCVTRPEAAGRTFLVSDGEDLSTPELLRRLGRAVGHPARLFPLPPAALEAAGALVGRRDVVKRLCGSLTVDITDTRRTLGWRPPVTVDDALSALRSK